MTVAPFSRNAYAWGSICGLTPASQSELIGARCIQAPSTGWCVEFDICVFLALDLPWNYFIVHLEQLQHAAPAVGLDLMRVSPYLLAFLQTLVIIVLECALGVDCGGSPY
jgi:hypothetical protein